MRKSESLEAIELEMDEDIIQHNENTDIAKENEMESITNSDLEDGQRTLFDNYGVIE